ncbi:hypothetical protein GCM10025794_16990 [Massilia kyonggiensis]|nr:hypothetical protein [Massilia kyonggiensis]
MTTKTIVECMCTGCGHTLQVACPHCAATGQPAPRGSGQRTDLVTALLVDAVISASAAEGTAYAARTLCENGVPFDVALRVLTRPWHRRYHPVSQMVATPADTRVSRAKERVLN